MKRVWHFDTLTPYILNRILIKRIILRRLNRTPLLLTWWIRTLPRVLNIHKKDKNQEPVPWSSGGLYTKEELDKASVKPHLVFMSTGEKENPVGTRKAADDLNAAGYNAMSHVSEGTAHEFLTWRRALHEMAPKLFKK